MREVDHRLAELFDVLSNPLRYRILLVLRDDPRSVGELADRLNRHLNVISRHLKLLRDHDLVWARSEGNRRIYDVKRSDLLEDCFALRAHLSREDPST